MRFVIVTGMSGAGKSSVLKMLEDIGYFCVDNLPIPLIAKFVQLSIESKDEINKIALGIDIRSGQSLMEMDQTLKDLEQRNYPYEILYLDANTETLVKRFKETRRIHPLSNMGRIESGIEAERSQMAFLKEKAIYSIDTSQMLVRDLKKEIDRIFLSNRNNHPFHVTILSFGFKYGLPMDSDLAFDVRFLPNPFYIEELKRKTGNDKEVYQYVMSFDAAKEFLDKIMDLLRFLIPNYIIEGKNQLVVSIGCTGGKHRSVTLANAVAGHLKEMKYSVKVEHRDVNHPNHFTNG